MSEIPIHHRFNRCWSASSEENLETKSAVTATENEARATTKSASSPPQLVDHSVQPMEVEVEDDPSTFVHERSIQPRTGTRTRSRKSFPSKEKQMPVLPREDAQSQQEIITEEDEQEDLDRSFADTSVFKQRTRQRAGVNRSKPTPTSTKKQPRSEENKLPKDPKKAPRKRKSTTPPSPQLFEDEANEGTSEANAGNLPHNNGHYDFDPEEDNSNSATVGSFKRMTRQTKLVAETQPQDTPKTNKRFRDLYEGLTVSLPRVDADGVSKKEKKFFRRNRVKGATTVVENSPVKDQIKLEPANHIEEVVEDQDSSDTTEIIEQPLLEANRELQSSSSSTVSYVEDQTQTNENIGIDTAATGNDDQADGNSGTSAYSEPFSEVSMLDLDQQDFEMLLMNEFRNPKEVRRLGGRAATGQDKNNILTIQNLIRFLDMRGNQRNATYEQKHFMIECMQKPESFLILMESIVRVRENKYLMQTETLRSLFGMIIENFKTQMILEFAETKRKWEGMLHILT